MGYVQFFGHGFTGSIDTVCTTLSTLVGTIDAQAITANGYFTKDDGGGGIFYWDAASVETIDNGLVFGNIAVTGRWKRVVTTSDGIYVAHFGIVLGAVTAPQLAANTTAVGLAVTAAKAKNKDLIFPAGNVHISASISYNATVGSCIRGQGSNLTKSAITFEITGAGIALSAQTTGAFKLENVDIYVDPGAGTFTGTVLDLTGSNNAKIVNSRLSILKNTGLLISLKNAYSILLDTVLFGACDIALRGKELIGDFSNAVSLINCSNSVGTVTNTVIQNPGEGWAIIGGAWEPIISGAPKVIVANFVALGLSITGNWFGDFSIAGTCISGSFDGLHVAGNVFSASVAGVATAFNFEAGSIGCNIVANTITGYAAVANFNTAMVSAHIFGNTLTTITNIVTGTTITTGVIQTDASKPSLFLGYETAKFSTLRARAIVSAAQNIPTGTPTKVSLTSVTYDPNGSFSASQFTAPVTGYYQANGYIDLNGMTVGNYVVSYIYVNGSPYTTGQVVYAGNAECGANVSDVVFANKGEAIALFVAHNHGSDVPILRGYLSCHYLSS